MGIQEYKIQVYFEGERHYYLLPCDFASICGWTWIKIKLWVFLLQQAWGTLVLSHDYKIRLFWYGLVIRPSEGRPL